MAKEKIDVLLNRLKSIIGNDEKLSLLRNTVLAIYPFLQLPFVNFLTKMPIDFMILILTISMGALGGGLSALRQFLEPNRQPEVRSAYIVQPVLGAIAAIAVFILFKAGQIVVSFGSNTEGQSLNPFLIAFLGVISGLVAKEAVARVEFAGNAVFRAPAPEEQQYALKAGSIINVGDDVKALLAQLVRVDRVTLDAMLAGQRSVSGQQADVIAAFLREPRNALFDLRPQPPPRPILPL